MINSDNIQQHVVNLPRGQLALRYQINSAYNYQLEDLLDFAERINPKRAFLFVSKVLGRHIPVAPTQMRQAFSDLATLIPDNLPEPILVIGMAETAVGLSAGVHQVLQQRYPHAILLNSTRHTQQGKLLTTFSEDHSHASTHLIYQSPNPQRQQQVFNAKTLIMVDDEASTGKTCQNVVQALRQAGLTQLTQIHLATLVDWSLGKALANSLLSIQFFRHTLLSGSWQWTDNPNPTPIHMPKVDSIEVGKQPLLDSGNWGRMPTLNSTDGLSNLLNNLKNQFDKLNINQGQKILVLGSNEFVWLPFLLAETLEHQGFAVKFGALTRSPIAHGGAITYQVSFQDNYGLGMPNFVYNVNPQAWDLIVLCIETPIHSVDKFWQDLDNILIINPK